MNRSRRPRAVPHDVAVVRPRRRALKVGIAVVLALGVVGGLGYGDVRLRSFAVERVSASVQNQLQLDQRPDVAFAGLFFIPQVAGRRFAEVDVDATDVLVGAEGFHLRLDTLDLTLTDVTTGDFTSYTAGRLMGTARVRWSSAQEVVHVPVRNGPGGRISADYYQNLMGQSIPVQVSAVPTINVEHQTFVLRDARATVQGYEIPDEVVQDAVEEMVRPTPISLPLGLRATAVRATPEGMELDIEGTDVALSG